MTQKQQGPRIAFLGIGLMGLPMARRIMQAGYPLTAWNRTRSKAELLGTAPVAAHVQDAVADADIVITMLQDGPAVHAVVEEALAVARPGMLFIDMSSTAMDEAQSLHRRLAERGAAFLDAPVSGGVAGAECGGLAIMVGGAMDHFRRAEPVLLAMGRPTWVGPVGSGQLAKLCNQLIVGATLEVVAEALLLAEAGGADAAAVRAAIRGGFAESRILEVHGARMLERNFLPGGQVRSQAKDLDNVLKAAASAGLRLPVAELVSEHFRTLLPAHAQADQSAALLALEQLNPGRRLGRSADILP